MSSRIFVPLVLSSLLVLFVSACAPVAQVADHKQAIIDGEPSDERDDSTVAIVIESSRGFAIGSCSGVLIADNVVLTARHCVSRTEGGGIACDEEGNPIAGGDVQRDRDPKQLAVIVGTDPSAEIAAVGKQIFNSGVDNLCNNDIAIILLDRSIPNAKIAPIRLDAPPKVDEPLLTVGWGVSNNSRGYQRRRRENVPVVAVGPSTDYGITGKNEFQIGEAICQGDSGGPAYASTGAVLGVVSRGGNGYPVQQGDPAYQGCINDGFYEAFNLYTRVDTFKPLIMQALEAAGKDPWIENGPDPRKAKFAATCSAGDQCRSSICAGEGTAAFCSQTCDATTNPCPMGYECQDFMGQKACLPPSGSCAATGTHSTGSRTYFGLILAFGLLHLVGMLARRRARNT